MVDSIWYGVITFVVWNWEFFHKNRGMRPQTPQAIDMFEPEKWYLRYRLT